ncbi:hypothetical protein GWO43_11885, partial [candidate division KSB1 bacterium]|nr:hypothetical protein [candidate division KSB1 bacterium]NIT71565.1 hypothetical protein [candidate division KSB1 bacterium]NIW68882.1 hypothetical protein [candidate division KSB1 bacterium]NIX71245.1 hypothetical protein [candidate division KSB1 bacterium]
MSLVEIKLRLDAGQFKAEGADVEQVTAKGSLSFQSFSAKATAASLAFNQVTAAVQQVASVLSKPIQQFAQLETSMANVATLGVDNIGQMTDEVLDMSEQISVPIADLSGGLFDVVSAGVDAAHQIEVLDITARSAKAGVATTSESLRLASA